MDTYTITHYTNCFGKPNSNTTIKIQHRYLTMYNRHICVMDMAGLISSLANINCSERAVRKKCRDQLVLHQPV